METISTYYTRLLEWLQNLDIKVIWAPVVVVICASVVAFFIHRLLGKSLAGYMEGKEFRAVRRFTLNSVQRFAFPLSMLLAVLVGRAIMRQFGMNTPVLDIFIPLLLSLAAIRLMVYMLRTGFAPGPGLKAWEQVISTTVWAIVALHLLGWLPGMLQAMDQLAYNFGETRVSILTLSKLLLMSVSYIVLALWLSGVIEQRLRRATFMNAGMKVGLSKFSRFFLLALAVLMALDVAGLDLKAFAVFGGALGVGIGFGLQKIVSNFISGFILLADRSIRPGDVISIGENFGWVEELRARYIVVRNREGVETLIPNENLVTTDVINWSYSDRKVRIRVPVQISYGDNPEQGMAIMVNAAFANPRVLKDPAPVARLMEFADSGITLELRVWVNDPEQGLANVRSDINVAIWRGFKEAGITIPFPQRDLHLKDIDAEAASALIR